MPETVNIFAPIVNKSEVADDGSITVYGKATGPDLDLVGQRCDPAWLAEAMPKWFEIGNIREMHQPSAVGKALELEQDGDDWYISAKIVDPIAVKKVQADIYTGFSIGIKGPKITKTVEAPNGLIHGGDVVETSLADRPVNETAKLLLAKNMGGELVEVEESVLGAGINDLLGKALDADLVKADELPLIQAAIAAIAELIQLEAAELPTDSSEIVDIATLLDALRALRQFWWSESAEGEIPDPLATAEALESNDDLEVITMSALADLAKAATADDATDEQKAEVAELRKAFGLDSIDEIVKGAVTEAVTAAVAELTKSTTTTTDEPAKADDPTEDRLKAIEGTLAEVSKALVPGGPVRTAQTAVMADTTKSEAADLRARAEKEPDATLRRGFLDLAEQAEAAAS